MDEHVLLYNPVEPIKEELDAIANCINRTEWDGTPELLFRT